MWDHVCLFHTWYIYMPVMISLCINSVILFSNSLLLHILSNTKCLNFPTMTKAITHFNLILIFLKLRILAYKTTNQSTKYINSSVKHNVNLYTFSLTLHLTSQGTSIGQYSYGQPLNSVSSWSDGNPDVHRTPLV